MILRKHLCTLISRIVQNAGTETTYGHHKTKVDDAWDIKNKKNCRQLWICTWAQGANIFTVEKLDIVECPYWSFDFCN